MSVPPAVAASKSRRRYIRVTILAILASLTVGLASLAQRYLRNMLDSSPMQSFTGAMVAHHPEILKAMYGCTDKKGKSVACTSGQMKKRKGNKGTRDQNTGDELDRVLFTEEYCAMDSNITRLFYNRIPKTGSTSMQKWIEGVASEQSPSPYKVISATKFRDRILSSDAEKAEFAENPIVSSMDKTDTHALQRGVMVSEEKYQELLNTAGGIQDLWYNGSAKVIFDRHIMYFDFREYGKEQPPMIALVRDPVERCRSRYNYEVDAKAIKAVRMDDCMGEDGFCKFESWEYTPEVHDHPAKMDRKALIREECASNYMTRWFCGMSSVCKTASEEALEKAIDNIRRDYVFVGVLEHMRMSAEVLKATLPSFFGKTTRQEEEEKE